MSACSRYHTRCPTEMACAAGARIERLRHSNKGSFLSNSEYLDLVGIHVSKARAESAVNRMFSHHELIRFESEATRIVEHENERFVCG